MTIIQEVLNFVRGVWAINVCTVMPKSKHDMDKKRKWKEFQKMAEELIGPILESHTDNGTIPMGDELTPTEIVSFMKLQASALSLGMKIPNRTQERRS